MTRRQDDKKNPNKLVDDEWRRYGIKILHGNPSTSLLFFVIFWQDGKKTKWPKHQREQTDDNKTSWQENKITKRYDDKKTRLYRNKVTQLYKVTEQIQITWPMTKWPQKTENKRTEKWNYTSPTSCLHFDVVSSLLFHFIKPKRSWLDKKPRC